MQGLTKSQKTMYVSKLQTPEISQWRYFMAHDGEYKVCEVVTFVNKMVNDKIL